MAAPPVPYRSGSNTQQYAASFPPPVYYRDTFGLQPISGYRLNESITSELSDSSRATKSTIRAPTKIYHSVGNRRRHSRNRDVGGVLAESQYTSTDDQTQSYHVEQIITDQVLIKRARPLLILTLIAFATALQLLIFAVISAFFDGSQYALSIAASLLFLLNTAALWHFLRYNHARLMLLVCILFAIVSIAFAVLLFTRMTYLIYAEERNQPRPAILDLSKTNHSHYKPPNHIIRNTRIAMYSLQMLYAPVQAVCYGAILYLLLINQRRLPDEGQLRRGFFLSEPARNQRVLVPITLRQVRRIDTREGVENTSIGVQTTAAQRDARREGRRTVGMRGTKF